MKLFKPKKKELTWEEKWAIDNPAYDLLHSKLKDLYVKCIYVSSSFFMRYIEERKKDTPYSSIQTDPLELYRRSLISGERIIPGNLVVPEIRLVAKNWSAPEILESMDLSEEL